MVLVDALSILNTTIQLRNVVLCEANKRLEVHENVKSEAETGVGRGKVLVAGALLIDFNDDEAGG